MGIFDSFRKSAQNPAPERKIADGASLQILLSAPLSDDFDALQAQIRAHAPTLKAATVSGVSTAQAGQEANSFLAEVSWGAHAVRVVAFPLPMPAEVVEICVAPAHYGESNKAEIRQQSAHACSITMANRPIKRNSSSPWLLSRARSAGEADWQFSTKMRAHPCLWA